MSSKISNSMTDSLNLFAPAKLNLFLEVKGKREDGFHELETVMTSVNLFDQMTLYLRDENEVTLASRTVSRFATLPGPEDNLIVKAIRLLKTIHGIEKGFHVDLLKRIPSQAGLGGASSDAAMVLLGANQLLDLNLSTGELIELAAQIGSDVPYFIHGGLAICRGRGEKVEPLNFAQSLHFLIAKPPIGLPTGEVFSLCNIPVDFNSPAALITCLQQRNLCKLSGRISNRLQEPANEITDWIERLSNAFDRVQCLAHQMTGSGSCYFGVFANQKLLRNAASRLLQRLPQVELYCCRGIRRLAIQRRKSHLDHTVCVME